jgi:hypothetical protein
MFKRLKRTLKEINRRQNGQVFILVLIVLALGGIILAPTLNYTATSLKHQQVHETKTLELYSADSGVASAMIALSSGNTTVKAYELNGRSVSVEITNLAVNASNPSEENFLITSTATSAGGGSTTIHTGISSPGGFADLLDNAITSNSNVIIKGEVVGNVTASGTVTETAGGSVNGTILEDVIFDNWPSADVFSAFYGSDVDKDNPEYTSGIIDLNGVSQTIGPCYVDNDLDIYNSINTATNLTLDGTLYITGDTLIGATNQEFTLDLNGNTIFIESDSTDPQQALDVGGKCTIIGSGCIIAVGEIYFGPNGDVGSADEFVFVMSIIGTTWLQPGGDYYGSIAGAADILLQPDYYLEWNSIGSEGNLNFPYELGVLGSSTTNMILGGWDIS